MTALCSIPPRLNSTHPPHLKEKRRTQGLGAKETEHLPCFVPWRGVGTLRTPQSPQSCPAASCEHQRGCLAWGICHSQGDPGSEGSFTFPVHLQKRPAVAEALPIRQA